jgi:hypothetical protein
MPDAAIRAPSGDQLTALYGTKGEELDPGA